MQKRWFCIPKRSHKKAQTFSIDTYIAIALFLVAIIVFYSLVNLKSLDDKLERDSSVLSHNLREDDVFGDGLLSPEEEKMLVEMDCDQLKAFFRTSKDVCLYFHDADGNVVILSNGTGTGAIRKYGIGCQGMTLGNVTCGSVVS